MTEDTGSRALLSDPTRRSDGLIARVSVTTQPDPACTAVTPEELAEIIDSIRHLHRPEAENPAYCNWCGDHWPCAQIVVCDALAASEARLAEATAELAAIDAAWREVRLPLAMELTGRAPRLTAVLSQLKNTGHVRVPAVRSAGEAGPA